MKNKICFFSVGFAFNRLVRMRFYEKIFPKNVEIYLFTTNKYYGNEKQNYQMNWSGLKRTKIVVGNYGLKLFSEFRQFCKKNNIDRIFNLGFHNSWPILFFGAAFSNGKRDYCINILTDVFRQHYLVESKKEKIKELLFLIYLWPGVFFSRKSFFTDELNAKHAPVFFLSRKNRVKWLAAPVDTELFVPMNKIKSRNKLGLPLNKNIVIFVGRINFLKCSDILKRVIESNKDIHFILVGRVIDNKIREIKTQNYKIIESLSSEELVDYYSASDLSFCLNRGGGGIGLSSEEALACGVPIVVSKDFKLRKSKALFEVPVDFEETNKAIKIFFSLNAKEKDEISMEARKYAEEYYSDGIWKGEYIKNYLN